MSTNNQNLEKQIADRIGEVRTDGTDISLGEIINLHSSNPKELIIQPDYQRLFRWTAEQRSRLIESILLELPIPQIFVIENQDSVLELIDGLQRISSVIHFIDHTLIVPEEIRQQVAPDPLRLSGCDIVKDLNGRTYADLPLSLKLRIKRSSVRMVTIKKSSSHMLRYEMFKRLNTGGSELSGQEIRNCTARMVGESGVRFYSFLNNCASLPAFKTCIEPLADAVREQKGDEELVLRFLAAKTSIDTFQGSVRDWLDEFMESIILGKKSIEYDREAAEFERLFTFLAQKLGEVAFVKYRQGRPIGGLAPAYFEAVAVGLLDLTERLAEISHENMEQTLSEVLESAEFRSFTGPGANTKEKLRGRIALIKARFERLA